MDSLKNITIYRIEPMENALARLRSAPLDNAGDEKIYVYSNADFAIRSIDPDVLNPTSYYVLREGLEFQRWLRWYFLEKYGIDTLFLPGIIHMETDDGYESMAPPFIEVYEENIFPQNSGQLLRTNFSVLLDGVHRAMIARENGISMSCIVVKNADTTYLPYAYPNAWSEVKVFDSVPPVKKFYRREERYSYVRPLYALRGWNDRTQVGR